MSASEPTQPSLASEAMTAATGAEASNVAPPQESLEDLLTALHKQIQGSDWLQHNTAEKWMEGNPEAAKELKKVLGDKMPEAPRPSPASSSESQDKA